MMSDDNMLNTATRTIIDKTTNIATRSTASASNKEAFMLFQSTIRPLLSIFGSNGASNLVYIVRVIGLDLDHPDFVTQQHQYLRVARSA